MRRPANNRTIYDIEEMATQRAVNRAAAAVGMQQQLHHRRNIIGGMGEPAANGMADPDTGEWVSFWLAGDIVGSKPHGT